METITVEIGERARLAQMTASESANHVARLVEEFGRDVMRTIDGARESRDTTAGAPMLTMSPSCKGCGMAVERGTDYCITCAAKPQFQGRAGGAPKAIMEMGAQPDPAYRDVPAAAVPR